VIVGYARTGLGPYEAFLWDPVRGLRSLKAALETEYGLALVGWSLEYGSSITPDGETIVGTGLDPSGNVQAFIATIPEPGTAQLLTAGLLVLTSLQRRVRVACCTAEGHGIALTSPGSVRSSGA
jgi:hypothetical protein